MNSLQLKQEAIGELQSRFESLHEKLDLMLSYFRNPEKYHETVDKLLKEFEAIKNLADFIDISAITTAAKTVIDVMSVLQYKNPPISIDLLEWFYMASDHMLEWNEYIQKGDFDLIPISPYILNIIRVVSINGVSVEEELAKAKIVYITENEVIKNHFKIEKRLL